jgi:hypothetical protein
MHRALPLLGTLALMVVAAPLAAEPPPPVNVIVAKMKEAFEPTRPSVRTMSIRVGDMGENEGFTVTEARKQLPDGKYMAIVLQAPADLRGTALLVPEFKDPKKPRTVWSYIPVLRRVRKLLPVDAYNHFLGTDFTYADLGFMRRDVTYRLLGVEQHAGVQAYKLDERFPQNSYYYSHIIVWVAQSSMLPLQRDYYEAGGALWKTEVFDSVTVIDGVPTVMHAKMTDLFENTSTDLKVTQIKYDVPIPDSVFDWRRLSQLADDPLWRASGCIP